LTAVVYVPAGRAADRWRYECARLCLAMRWTLVALTADPGTARRLLVEGRAVRVVVARPAHARQVQLPVVVVTDPAGRPQDPGRPRRLR
jgi:hypothetical protein